MYGNFQQHLQKELQAIEEAGLYKRERIITTPQGAVVKTTAAGAALRDLRARLDIEIEACGFRKTA